MQHVHPILTCKAALAYEQEFLGEDKENIWQAMQSAGRLLGLAILEDYRERGQWPKTATVLILAGKGHNGGDALLAGALILAQQPQWKAQVVLASAENDLKPASLDALACLQRAGLDRVTVQTYEQDHWVKGHYTLIIDGLLGMQCRPPLRSPYRELIEAANCLDKVHLRAAVDLPSGLGDEACEPLFCADFTYATGIAKTPLFKHEAAGAVGRIRYLDIGFFSQPAQGFNPEEGEDTSSACGAGIILPSVLEPLQQLRPSQSDKRSYGHLFVLGGSRAMPGALLMATLAAIRSGVGLATVFAPSSVTNALAPLCPEAMAYTLPESAEGHLTAAGRGLLSERWEQATALLVGPGMVINEASAELLREVVRDCPRPLILDAGALQANLLETLKERPEQASLVILTPHLGEFRRMAGGNPRQPVSDEELKAFCARHRVVTLLKGPVSCLCDGKTVLYSLYGGPVLARGGSGDILAGLTAGLCARHARQGSIAKNTEALRLGLKVASQAVTLHGLAAELLARSHGQEAVCTTQLLDYLGKVKDAAK